VAGGLLGALVDLGVPHQEAEYYAEGVRRGGTLVSVHTDDKKVPLAQRILQQYQPINHQQRVDQWRQSGWTGYDPKAAPYTSDQLNQERARYGMSTTRTTTTTTSPADNSGTRVYPGK